MYHVNKHIKSIYRKKMKKKSCLFDFQTQRALVPIAEVWSDVETKNARVFKVNLHQDLGQEVERDIRFERKVVIYFGDKLVYEADSLVSVKDYKTLGLLAKHEFGLGQNMVRQDKKPFGIIQIITYYSN
ncbi:hypothetical protein BDC45DRAFT_531264 [Circinella umbellata]|nr:hypothetical protein BDC45DRAFT_531264 [Circinella umbellata]